MARAQASSQVARTIHAALIAPHTASFTHKKVLNISCYVLNSVLKVKNRMVVMGMEWQQACQLYTHVFLWLTGNQAPRTTQENSVACCH